MPLVVADGGPRDGPAEGQRVGRGPELQAPQRVRRRAEPGCEVDLAPRVVDRGHAQDRADAGVEVGGLREVVDHGAAPGVEGVEAVVVGLRGADEQVVPGAPERREDAGGRGPSGRADLGLPDLRARLRVDRLDPPVLGPVEHARTDRQGHDRRALLRRPAERRRLPGAGPGAPRRPPHGGVDEPVVRGHQHPVRAHRGRHERRGPGEVAPPHASRRRVERSAGRVRRRGVGGRGVAEEHRVAVDVPESEPRVGEGLNEPRAGVGRSRQPRPVPRVRRERAGRRQRRRRVADLDGVRGRRRVHPLQAVASARAVAVRDDDERRDAGLRRRGVVVEDHAGSGGLLEGRVRRAGQRHAERLVGLERRVAEHADRDRLRRLARREAHRAPGRGLVVRGEGRAPGGRSVRGGPRGADRECARVRERHREVERGHARRVALRGLPVADRHLGDGVVVEDGPDRQRVGQGRVRRGRQLDAQGLDPFPLDVALHRDHDRLRGVAGGERHGPARHCNVIAVGDRGRLVERQPLDGDRLGRRHRERHVEHEVGGAGVALRDARVRDGHGGGRIELTPPRPPAVPAPELGLRVLLDRPQLRVVRRVDHGGAVVAPAVAAAGEILVVAGFTRLQQTRDLHR